MGRSWLIFAALLAPLLFLGQCRQSRDDATDERLTLAWQQANCPRADALDDLLLPGGRVANVEIFEMFGERLYVPRQWLRAGETQASEGQRGSAERWPNGVRATARGPHGHAPWRAGERAEGAVAESCLGTVFRSIPSHEPTRPRFTLSIAFRRSTPHYPDGRILDAGSRTYGFQRLLFVYRETAAPLPWTVQARPAQGPRTDIGEGWFTVPRELAFRDAGFEGTYKLGIQVAIDGLALHGSSPADAETMAFRTQAAWSFHTRLGAQMDAVYDVGVLVPVARWRHYRDTARDVHEWLKSRPSQRDNDRQFIF